MLDSPWEISQWLLADSCYAGSTSLKGSLAVFKILNAYTLNLVVPHMGIDPTDIVTRVLEDVTIYAGTVYGSKSLQAFPTELVKESVGLP